MKEYANVSMQRLADLIDLKTPKGRSAVGRSTVLNNDGNHLLQIPVRLYILLHFYSNSNDGVAEALSPAELAENLACNVKSVRAGLLQLSNAGFISCTDVKSDFITAVILNIKTMYKKRGEGGRGYVVINGSLRDRILSVTRINPLRVSLRALIETATAELNSAKTAKAIIRFDSLRAGLPKYIKPCVIRASLTERNGFSAIFEKDKEGKHSIVIRLRDEFNGRHTKAQLKASARSFFHDWFKNINGAISAANESLKLSGVFSSEAYRTFRMHGMRLENVSLTGRKEELPLIDSNTKLIEDCAVISQDYGIDSVTRALQIYYEDYLLGNFTPDPKRPIGGLLRSITKNFFSIGDPSVA